MATLEMPHVDLECGRRSSAGVGSPTSEEDEEEGSVCFSDADEGSCNSQFYSTAGGDGSYDDYSIGGSSEILEDETFESRRASSADDLSDCSVDIESGGVGEKKVHLGGVERDCRICHLSLVSSSPGSGVAIELGCSCKDDLSAAHKHCAETWFKIKGNKTCEICNSVARNVVGPNDIEAAQAASEGSVVASAASSIPAPSATETRSCLNGHRFLNFLLACMVFAFVISWLFHFNIPS
ncbi:hypothetical protein Sango_2005700 [Sesamum angolense]|uniref:RING-CH-type domain-containing protein n=1 Tax=Sesamum angolense TaxID=2727404 RepID=A0AAE1WFF1_9LAMI|nr:hypothetical protein Sango_2005700 [Sesamum angolense]